METRATYSTAFIVRPSKGSKQELFIYCRITVNSQRAEFSIKRTVLESLWDNGKVKGNNEAAKALNSYLTQLAANI